MIFAVQYVAFAFVIALKTDSLRSSKMKKRQIQLIEEPSPENKKHKPASLYRSTFKLEAFL